MFIYISLSLILSFNLIADDHNVKIESDGTVGEFNYVTVTDPINFMMMSLINLNAVINGEMNQMLM